MNPTDLSAPIPFGSMVFVGVVFVAVFLLAMVIWYLMIKYSGERKDDSY